MVFGGRVAGRPVPPRRSRHQHRPVAARRGLARDIGGQAAAGGAPARRARASIRGPSASAGSCRRSGATASRSATCCWPRCSCRSSPWSTPLFFQVVVDKVLTHKGYSTLFVLVVGLVVVGLFDVVLQYLRTYALSHTTNRIDVELGAAAVPPSAAPAARLFRDPRRPARPSRACANSRTIRAFLTGQGAVLGARPRLHLRLHRGAVRLFVDADAHRAGVDPALRADRLLASRPPLREHGRGEVQHAAR